VPTIGIHEIFRWRTADMTGKLLAEAIGTFWLVLGGCGSAIFAAAYPDLGIGFLGVSLAFGLTVLSMAAAVGHISGCHLNPAGKAGPGEPKQAGRAADPDYAVYLAWLDWMNGQPPRWWAGRLTLMVWSQRT